MSILILKFPYSSQFGGGEKHTINLVESLRERGYKFYLVSSCRVLLEEFKKRKWSAVKLWAGKEPVTEAWVFLFLLLSPIIFLELFFVLLYYRIFKKTKVLYCLSLTDKIIATPLARIFGMKVVWVEHTSIGRWLKLNPWRIFYVLWSRLVTVVAVSEAVKKQLLKIGVKEKNLKVIYNGVDVSGCEFMPAVKNFRTNFSVGTVCRLHHEKGVEFLLKAIKIAKEFIPTLRLVVIGDGPERQNLIWLTKQLEIYDSVLFVGFQGNIEGWVKDFDIFVLPSVEKEAFGIVSLNALACGKPVVATRVGGIPEVVEDGKTGLLVEPKSAEEIARAIVNLHRHPEIRREMGVRGRKTVEEKFSLDKMIDEYETLFN